MVTGGFCCCLVVFHFLPLEGGGGRCGDRWFLLLPCCFPFFVNAWN